MTVPVDRRAWHLLAALTAAALLLRVLGLGAQILNGDDLGVAATAANYTAAGWPEPTMWNHPRLRDLLVQLSMSLLGDGPWGIKLWSVLFGTLSVAATGALVLAVGGTTGAALAAAALVASDPLHLDFSRQGINDVYLAFFPVAAIVALAAYRAVPRPALLAAAGVLLGLGLASKWSAAFPVGAAALFLGVARLRASEPGAPRRAEAALLVAALVLLPLAVYLLTWWPRFGRGHGLAEWVQFHLAMAAETTRHVGYEGTKLPGYPGEVIRAWRWFVTPVWFVDFVTPRSGTVDVPTFVTGVPNPLAWLAVWPAFALALVRWRRHGDRTAAALAVLFLVTYLPFAVATRPIWTNSAVGVAPFALALVGWAAATVWPRHRRAVTGWGVAAAVLAALLWLPAVGVTSRVTDTVMRVFVDPVALDPASHV